MDESGPGRTGGASGTAILIAPDDEYDDMIQSNWFPMPTGNFVCREFARALIHTARPSYDTGDTVSLRLSAGSRLLNHVAADRLKPHLPHANENH